MTRSKMLSEITRIEAGSYRNVGRNMLGYYTREPIGYRHNLKAIYSKLSDEELNALYDIKVIGFNKLLKLKKKL
jgi:hypothetical protein